MSSGDDLRRPTLWFVALMIFICLMMWLIARLGSCEPIGMPVSK